jgi:alpha-galactosidase/6-phospho-beta-glucosidase family protein
MRELMRDVYLLDELQGGEIRLVDPNTEHVQVVADLLRTFNRLRNKNFKISIVENRREALDHADFVVATFSPGSLDAFYNDLEIPVKYGIRLPVSMTVGIPGISSALRTVPVAYEMVRDMEEMCPGAWMLNVTNPMSTVTRAMNMAAFKTKVVGLCHEFHAFDRYMGPMLGLHRPEKMDILTYLYQWLPEQGFDYTIAGVNHFIWLTRAALRGVDVLPQIREYCFKYKSLDEGVQAWKGEVARAAVFQNSGEAKFALCRQFGYLPMAGDRHLIEYYPSLCNLRNGFGLKYNVTKTTVDGRVLYRDKNLAYMKDIIAGKETVCWERSGEELTDVMRAVMTGQPATLIANLPNSGQIANMPADVAVETLARVSRAGVQPVPAGDLPGAIGSLCRLHADIHEMTIKAAMEGDRKLLIEAMSLDPSSGGADFSEIPDLAEALLSANRQWLPRFYE